MIRVLFFVFIILFVSCQPQENKTEILTEGVLDPVTIEVVGGADRGEFLTGGIGDDITVKVRNNSKFNLTDLTLTLDSSSAANVQFMKDSEGKSKSPGFGGTCYSVLAPGSECTFILRYGALVSGTYTQDFTLTYKNLADAESFAASLKFFTGEAASLIFEGEQINYDLGIIEQTDSRDDFEYILKVINKGELNARGIVFSELPNIPGAFNILQNDCPQVLAAEEFCTLHVRFKPLNNQPTDPEVEYLSTLNYQYGKDPEGGIGNLSGYFKAISTKIAGRFESSGSIEVEFEEIIVGNFLSRLFKIVNNGYKEAILKSINLKNSSGSFEAKCINEGNTYLDCKVHNDLDGATRAIADVPFKIKDTNNCVIPYSDFGYTRLPDDSLDNPTIKQVAGRTIADPGEGCIFEVIFHPSVTKLTDGTYTDWSLLPEYDSTWKNTIDMVGSSATDPELLTFKSADYLSAARLEVLTNDVSFNAVPVNPYNRIITGTTDEYYVDLGRIALINDVSYASRFSARLSNLGSSEAVVSRVEDGNGTNILATSANTNNYYRSVSHVGCDFVAGTSGNCQVRFSFTPLASTNPDPAAAEAEENAWLQDSGEYKLYKLTYTDGATYEDDMSLRQPRELLIYIRSKLVRKGFLVYEDFTMSNNRFVTYVNGQNHKFVKLRNAGTGGIPYIALVNSLPFDYLMNWYASLFNNATLAMDFMRTPSGELGPGEKDCFDLISWNEDIPPTVPMGTNAPSILDVGEVCVLTVLSQPNPTMITPDIVYSDAGVEKERSVSIARGDNYNNEPAGGNDGRALKFLYYDGDGVGDMSYTPALAGYGDQFNITGGVDGEYTVNSVVHGRGKLVLDSVNNVNHGGARRIPLNVPAVTQGTYTPNLTGTGIPALPFGFNQPAYTVNSLSYDMSDGVGVPPVSFNNIIYNYLENVHLDNSVEYTVYLGTIVQGEGDLISGFTILNSGQSSVQNMTVNITGDAELEEGFFTTGSLNSSETRSIPVTIKDSTVGTFEKIFDFTFEDSVMVLNSISPNFSYTPNQVNVRFKVIANVIAAGSENLSLDVAFYDVTDDGMGTITEVLGASSSALIDRDGTGAMHVLKAIKGANVFAKKRFTITNNSPNPLYKVNFYLTRSRNGVVATPTIPGVGFSISPNSCTNATLNPGDSCFVDIKYSPTDTDPSFTSLYGVVSYSFDDQYLYSSKAFRVQMASTPPAKLAINGMNTNIVYDCSGRVDDCPNAAPVPFTYPSYVLPLGFYTDVHPVFDTYPITEYKAPEVNIDNSSPEKASLLKQYRLHVGDDNAQIGAGTWHTIFESSIVKVEAVRGCFYGDDEGSAIPINQQGFSSGTSLANKCKLQFTYKFNTSDINKKINTHKSFTRIAYYNNARASFDYLNFGLSGFLEADPSLKSPDFNGDQIFNVTSNDQGEVHFSWKHFSPVNLGVGNIIGYKVYYSTQPNSLNDIFENTLNSVETVTNEVTLTGFMPARYYYFKVVAVREADDGVKYDSISDFAHKEIVVPEIDSFYDYERKRIYDKYVSPRGTLTIGDQDETRDVCNNEVAQYMISGILTQKNKKLILRQDFEDLIIPIPENSDYNVDLAPHWMGDNSFDISLEFSPFNCMQTANADLSRNFFYNKECNNCSCIDLPMMYGTDGSVFPLGSTIFTEAHRGNGLPRCYFDQ